MSTRFQHQIWAVEMKVFPGHCTIDRQPEIADEMGNTYIAETKTALKFYWQIWDLSPWRTWKSVSK